MNKILPIILVVVLFFFPELLLSYERDAWEGGSSRLGGGGGSGIGGFLTVLLFLFGIVLFTLVIRFTIESVSEDSSEWWGVIGMAILLILYFNYA